MTLEAKGRSLSAIPELRLTQHALQRHTKASANRPKTLFSRDQPASSEMDDSLPSADPEGAEMGPDARGSRYNSEFAYYF